MASKLQRRRLTENQHLTSSLQYNSDCYTKLVGHPGYVCGLSSVRHHTALSSPCSVTYILRRYQGNHTKTFVSGANNAWITTTEFDLDNTPTTPIYTFPEAGVYEFELSGRSRDFFVDRIILFHTDRVEYDNAIDPSVPESSSQIFGEHGQLSRIARVLLTSAGNETRVLGPVEQNDVIDLTKVGSNLSMIVAFDGFASEVEFFYNDVTWREGGAPYAMAGNQGEVNNAVPYLSTPGNKLVRATLYVDGFPQDTLQLSFTIIQTEPTAPPSAAPTTAPTVAPTSLAPTTAGPTSAPSTRMMPTLAPTVSRQRTFTPTGFLQLNRVSSAAVRGTTSGPWVFVGMLIVAVVVAAL